MYRLETTPPPSSHLEEKYKKWTRKTKKREMGNEDISSATPANYYQKMGLTNIYREGAGLQLSEVGAD
jgi:hypothetical protein